MKIYPWSRCTTTYFRTENWQILITIIPSSYQYMRETDSVSDFTLISNRDRRDTKLFKKQGCQFRNWQSSFVSVTVPQLADEAPHCSDVVFVSQFSTHKSMPFRDCHLTNKNQLIGSSPFFKSTMNPKITSPTLAKGPDMMHIKKV